MLSSKGAFYLLLIALTLDISFGNTKYFVKLRNNPSDLFKTKNPYDLRVLHYPLNGGRISLQDDIGARIQDEDQSASKDFGPKIERRNSFEESSTFNPDVLNKFLEEYASKIKSTTERNYKYPFRVSTSDEKNVNFGSSGDEPLEKEVISSETVVNLTTSQGHYNDLNDTSKRNSYWSNSNSHDDRNGWVTLDAIPWSKSKISKWQANNPTSQRPWPDANLWEKPNSGKPVQSEFNSRPSYENNKPWYNRHKPSWQDQSGEKPWYYDRPKPSQSKPIIDRYEENFNQAQTWPPEKPSWNKYSDKNRPGDIITDERPSNFPHWERPHNSKPSYSFPDRYTIKNDEESSNWKTQNFHDRPHNYRPSDSNDRPNFSQYQYLNDHPSSHPSTGDGQWILLSTNRGYSKTRQRSIKIDSIKPESLTIVNGTTNQSLKNNDNDPPVPVMTSRRQVRLTVLPSVNGTNTTTSHGGLLEVERTFKTVDQSQKEYENSKRNRLTQTLNKRPIRNTIFTGTPSNSAILAAVGAGMLPATMAMMIPMMLGRKKRDIENSPLEHTLTKTFYLNQGLQHLLDKHNSQRTKLLRF